MSQQPPHAQPIRVGSSQPPPTYGWQPPQPPPEPPHKRGDRRMLLGVIVLIVVALALVVSIVALTNSGSPSAAPTHHATVQAHKPVVPDFSSSAPAPAPSPTRSQRIFVPPPPVTHHVHSHHVGLSQSNIDRIYVQTLRQNLDNPNVPPHKAIKLGHTICQFWSRGGTFPQLIRLFQQNGFDAHDAGFITGSATAAYCPQYQGRI